MKAVRIRVSGYALKNLLHIPQDADIIGANVKEETDDVVFLIWHQDLPCVDREEPPLIWPIIHYEPEKYTWDWNLPKEEK